MKSLLLHAETKRQLTMYLSHKFIATCEEKGKEYAVVFGKRVQVKRANSEQPPHEEADTLLVLYGIDIARNDQFQKLVICSPDADVLLLLIYFTEYHLKTKAFLTGKMNHIRNIDVGASYEALGEEMSASILGFHSFPDCDQTAKFYWKYKLFCWKMFMNSQNYILESLRGLGSRR